VYNPSWLHHEGILVGRYKTAQRSQNIEDPRLRCIYHRIC
jgi:hypothetical protein